ncbi:MAG: hypothetical protein AAGA56_08510 [Myxococcota bacterium]
MRSANDDSPDGHVFFQIRFDSRGNVVVTLDSATVRLDRESFCRMVEASNRAVAQLMVEPPSTALAHVN